MQHSEFSKTLFAPLLFILFLTSCSDDAEIANTEASLGNDEALAAASIGQIDEARINNADSEPGN